MWCVGPTHALSLSPSFTSPTTMIHFPQTIKLQLLFYSIISESKLHVMYIGCVCARVILIVTSKRWHVWSWIEYLRWQNCCTTILATLLKASKGWTIAEFIVAVCVLAKWKWNSSRIILYANVIISIQCAWWNTTLYCRNASCSTQQMPTLLIPWGWTTADITGN